MEQHERSEIAKLPREIWLYQIVEYCTTLDMLFSLGRVCKVFRYELANEYLKRKFRKKKEEKEDEEVEEKEDNMIDNFSVNRIKYLIRCELLDFIVKYEKLLANDGILGSEEVNSESMMRESTNQSLKELFESRMELFKFYLSHFYSKQPSQPANHASAVSSLFSHKDQIVQTATPKPSDQRKVLVIGDGGVGKTTFCKSLKKDYVFDSRYLVSIGVETTSHRLRFGDNETTINLWDTAGPEKFGGLRDAYYLNASMCIICFDLTSRVTYKNTPNWHRDVKRVVPNCEIIFVGTKVDCTEKLKVQTKHIMFPFKKFCPYISMSCLEQVNNRAVMWYAVLIDYLVSNLKCLP